MKQTTWKRVRWTQSGVAQEHTARRNNFTLRVTWWLSGTVVGIVERVEKGTSRHVVVKETRAKMPKGANTNTKDAEPFIVNVKEWCELIADAEASR